MRMEVTEAIKLVVALANGNACMDRTEPECAEAVDVVKDHFRREYGVEFPGDDVLGSEPIERDAGVVFIPIRDDQVPYRADIAKLPVAGHVEEIDDEGPDYFPDGIYRIRLDDAKDKAKCTRVRAAREELQLVSYPHGGGPAR